MTTSANSGKRLTGARPAGARLSSKTVATPSSPVKTKPPTAAGDDEAKRSAGTRTRDVKQQCFIDDDHSKLTAAELELFPTEVQLPGSTIKARALVCLHHQVQMEALKSDALGAARAMNMAPYGKCFVCDEPVGLREEDTPFADKPGDTVPVNFWYRMDKPEDVLHERCRRGYKETVEDEDGNISKPGFRRRIVLV